MRAQLCRCPPYAGGRACANLTVVSDSTVTAASDADRRPTATNASMPDAATTAVTTGAATPTARGRIVTIGAVVEMARVAVVRIRRIGQSMALIVAIVAIPLSSSALARTDARRRQHSFGRSCAGSCAARTACLKASHTRRRPSGRCVGVHPSPRRTGRAIRDATRPGSPCAQVPLTVLPGGKAILPGASNLTGSTSEDCLYLNVWTPARPTHPRPVFVWFHGGNDIYGAGSDYDGSKLTVEGGVWS